MSKPILWHRYGDHPAVGYYRHPPVDPLEVDLLATVTDRTKENI